MALTEVSPLSRMSFLRIVLVSIFIFVATVMSFVNSVNAKFVNWDDDVYVTENPVVQELTPANIERMVSETHYYAWIPATLISHAFDFAIWGMNPKGHHLTNVLLHSFNAVLIFFLCLNLFGAGQSDNRQHRARGSTSIIVGSMFAALLFSMHPQRVESVAWVSGRKDLLCCFFLLWSLISYLRWKASGKDIWQVASLVSFAVALVSKPAAVAFPFVLILVDIWCAEKTSARRDTIVANLKDKIPYFLLSALVTVITMVAAFGGTADVVSELNSIERILLPVYSLCFYLWKLIVPLDLSPVYPELESVLLYLSPVIVVAIGYGCLNLWRKKQWGLPIALIIYAVILLPTLVGLRTGMQPLADRYAYLSTIGLFAFVGGCIEWLWRKSAASGGKLYQREALAIVLLMLTAMSAYRTIRHTAIWNNSISLWSHALRYSPSTEGEYRNRAPYMKPNYLDARINLGTAFYAAEEKEKAWGHFESVLALDSCNADAHYNLGILLTEGGDQKSAEQAFARTIVCDPSYAKAYHNLGTLFAQRDSSSSVEMYRRAARLGVSESQVLLRQRGMRW
jgi:hypothetical protein